MVLISFTSDWLKQWRECFKPIVKKQKQITSRHSNENSSNKAALVDLFVLLSTILK